MTRWVRWPTTTKWHAVKAQHGSLFVFRCGMALPLGRVDEDGILDEPTFSDFEPVEDECRQCRRALDGGKT